VWDDAAIRRVMDDGRALPYGVMFWVVANVVPWLLFNCFGPPSTRVPLSGHTLLKLMISMATVAVGMVLQLGIVHLVAKFFCAGDGTLLQVLRPMSLASIILLVEAVPPLIGLLIGETAWATLGLVAYLLGNIAWVAVMVMVFDVVDGMDQIVAFVTSIASVFGLSTVAGYLIRR
jgi:hypothetical protein